METPFHFEERLIVQNAIGIAMLLNGEANTEIMLGKLQLKEAG